MHGANIRLLHEGLQRGIFDLKGCHTQRVAADMFTKLHCLPTPGATQSGSLGSDVGNLLGRFSGECVHILLLRLVKFNLLRDDCHADCLRVDHREPSQLVDVAPDTLQEPHYPGPDISKYSEQTLSPGCGVHMGATGKHAGKCEFGCDFGSGHGWGRGHAILKCFRPVGRPEDGTWGVDEVGNHSLLFGDREPSQMIADPRAA